MRPKDIQHPALLGEPCDHAGLDRTEISVNEYLAISGDKACADQRRECDRNTAVNNAQGIELMRFDEFTGEAFRRNRIVREVLHLHKASGLAPGAVGPVKSQQSAHTAVCAHAGLNGVILLCRSLAELLPDLKHPRGGFAGYAAVKQILDGILAQIA